MVNQLKNKVVGAVATAALVTAGLLAGQFEGTRYRAYKDPVGIWTICEGHTQGVKPGDAATVEQCSEYKRQDLKNAERVVDSCIVVPLTIGQRASLIDFAYNVGAGGMRVKDGLCTLYSGTAPRIRYLFNAGRATEACHEFPKWNRQQLPGITTRRAAEEAVCLS